MTDRFGGVQSELVIARRNTARLLAAGGLERGARHYPLIVALHGAYGNGAFMERYSGLSRLADREGFAVVYPDAAGSFWRISADGADVRFIDVLLDRVLAGGCFDAARVSAVGVSNGAGMVARFAWDELAARLSGDLHTADGEAAS